jgi:type VI secretion system FHA domain protein
MILTLEVTGEHADEFGAAGRKVFEGMGGTIGRLPDNDWVFPDPYISGRHALIRYLSGKFFVEDISTNGVFINSPANRLPRAQPHPLQSGDVLYIDAYQIRVSIDADSREENDPFAMLNRNPNASAPNAGTAGFAPQPSSNSTDWFGMGDLASRQPQQTPVPGRGRSDPSRADAPRAAVAAESVAAAAAAAPAIPKQVAVRRSVTVPVKVSANAAANSRNFATRGGGRRSEDSMMRQLLASAGIQGVEPSEELAQTIGEVLRVTVAGLMEVLRARERVKDELRIRGTSFKPANNNPLKFSANVDDAFHNLLVKRNPAYLSAPASFDDAMSDIRDHQAAILAALRLAFETMLARFDPNRLQEDFDRQIRKGSILGAPAKLRYWDLYRDKYGELVKDADSGFRNLFGEEFTKAYEEQLKRLKALGRSNRDK